MEGRTAPSWTAGAFWRHGGGLNAAFLNGHAHWVPFKELYHVDTYGQGFYWYRYATIDR
jgi:hypothetical protein